MIISKTPGSPETVTENSYFLDQDGLRRAARNLKDDQSIQVYGIANQQLVTDNSNNPIKIVLGRVNII